MATKNFPVPYGYPNTIQDANTITKAGVYRFVDAINVPFSGWGILISTFVDGTAVQLCTNLLGTEPIYLRYRVSGTWSAWSEKIVAGHTYTLTPTTADITNPTPIYFHRVGQFVMCSCDGSQTCTKANQYINLGTIPEGFRPTQKFSVGANCYRGANFEGQFRVRNVNSTSDLYLNTTTTNSATYSFTVMYITNDAVPLT